MSAKCCDANITNLTINICKLLFHLDHSASDIQIHISMGKGGSYKKIATKLGDIVKFSYGTRQDLVLGTFIIKPV